MMMKDERRYELLALTDETDTVDNDDEIDHEEGGGREGRNTVEDNNEMTTSSNEVSTRHKRLLTSVTDDDEAQLEAIKKQITWSIIYLLVALLITLPYFQGNIRQLHISSTSSKNGGSSLIEDARYVYEVKEWNINKSMYEIWRNEMPEFVACLEAPIDEMERKIEKSYPPNSLTIVQSISDGLQDNEFDYATSMMACYCHKYNCQAHQNSVDTSKYSEHKSFFTARWRSIKERFWDSSEWVFGMDTDLVPINFDKDVKDFIKDVTDRASVIIHARRNMEIVASPLGFKTHDKFANCFFERFNTIGRFPQSNYDNGDIIETVFRLVAPEMMGKCEDYRLLNYQLWIQCFADHVYAKFTEAEMEHENHVDKNVGIGPYGLPIKIFMPMEGFYRQYEGPLHVEHPDIAEYNVLPSDVFIHGYKRIGHLFGQNDSIYHCGRPYYDNYGNRKKYDPPLHIAPQEMYWSQEQVLNFTKRCCLIKYHGCVKNEAKMLPLKERLKKVNNICLSERCQRDATHGLSGVGFNDNEHQCWPPYPRDATNELEFKFNITIASDEYRRAHNWGKNPFFGKGNGKGKEKTTMRTR